MCDFCHDYHCEDCMSHEILNIPFQFLKNGKICKKGHRFLSEFKYFKLDSKNPLLLQAKEEDTPSLQKS